MPCFWVDAFHVNQFLENDKNFSLVFQFSVKFLTFEEVCVGIFVFERLLDALRANVESASEEALTNSHRIPLT